MARFTDLPSEILLLILKYVWPDDIESFTSVSKHIYDVSGAVRAEHRRLIQEFRVIRAPTSSEDWVSLAERILSHEVARYYVKHLRSRRWEFGSRLDFGTACHTSEVSAAGETETIPLILWNASDRQSSVQRVQYGDQFPVWAGLLQLCENIRKITLLLGYIDPQTFADYLQKQAEDQSNRGMPHHLRNVELHSKHGLGLVSLITMLREIAAIPSVTNVRLVGLCAADSEIFVIAKSPYGRLPLRELSLYGCKIRAKALHYIVQQVKELESFSIDSDDAYRDKYRFRSEWPSCPIDAFWLCQPLISYGKSSLKSLVIRRSQGCNHGDAAAGDMRSFESLSYLGIEFPFTGEWEVDDETPLPSSIERVDILTQERLSAAGRPNEHHLWNVLGFLFRLARYKVLAKLKTVCLFTLCGRMDVERNGRKTCLDEIHQKLERRGIDLYILHISDWPRILVGNDSEKGSCAKGHKNETFAKQ